MSIKFNITNSDINGLAHAIVSSGLPMQQKYDPEKFAKDVFAFETFIYPLIGQEGMKNIVALAKGETQFSGSEPVEFLDAIKHLKRAFKLGSAKPASGHDCFTKGIKVDLVVTYPVYWSPQFQRYHFADIVSSTSAMHRLTRLDLDEAFNQYVTNDNIEIQKRIIGFYNECVKMYGPKEKFTIYINPECESEMSLQENTEWRAEETTLEKLYMVVISNVPQGLMKTMTINTNYLQLKTMYHQRRHHKLEEWQLLCDFIYDLPFFKELCLGE